jgi:CheY-like chemotaxis protein
MKILIADDDADDRNLAAMAFEELNTEHEIEFVNDGQELVDMLGSLTRGGDKLPDLILLDLNMPRKDGRVALKEIKNNPAFRHIEVHILSTSTSEEDKKFTQQQGAKNYFVKPTNFEALMRILKTVCEELVE